MGVSMESISKFLSWTVHTWSSRGVRSLKFLTPTPLLLVLRLNILRLCKLLKFWTPTPAYTPKWMLWTFGSV